jgi:hypothetical protein
MQKSDLEWDGLMNFGCRRHVRSKYSPAPSILMYFPHLDGPYPEIEIEKPPDPTPEVDKERKGVVSPETEH